jgi:hypothetical protein
MRAAMTYLCTPGALMPVARYAERYECEFQVGKYYTLEPVTERSRESHNLYFACVHVAWANLQAPLADRFVDADEFRKWCLIVRGFRHQRITVFSSNADAILGAAVAQNLRDFSVTVVEDNMLTVLTAKTQKLSRNDPGGMDKKDFEASKEAVIEEASFRIGLSVEQLVAEAKKQMVREKRVHIKVPAT